MTRTLFLVIAVVGSTLVARAQVPRATDLPDWSGAWTRATGGFFEATAGVRIGLVSEPEAFRAALDRWVAAAGTTAAVPSHVVSRAARAEEMS